MLIDIFNSKPLFNGMIKSRVQSIVLLFVYVISMSFVLAVANQLVFIAQLKKNGIPVHEDGFPVNNAISIFGIFTGIAVLVWLARHIFRNLLPTEDGKHLRQRKSEMVDTDRAKATD